MLVVALISGDPGREGSVRMMVETLQGQLAQATGNAVGWASPDKVQGSDQSQVYGDVSDSVERALAPCGDSWMIQESRRCFPRSGHTCAAPHLSPVLHQPLLPVPSVVGFLFGLAPPS